jgi:hypothetical protein
MDDLRMKEIDDAVEAACLPLVEALRLFMDRMQRYGEFDDNAFYYSRQAASELMEPMEKARAALARWDAK